MSELGDNILPFVFLAHPQLWYPFTVVAVLYLLTLQFKKKKMKKLHNEAAEGRLLKVNGTTVSPLCYHYCKAHEGAEKKKFTRENYTLCYQTKVK